MKTASFFTFKDAGRISIARSAPRGVSVPTYKPLAPGAWFNSVDYDAYRKLYFAQLSQLDPEKVVADLNALAGASEPVLLCWEMLRKPGEYCHRRMVAEWLELELGMVVLEHGANSTPQTTSLF